MTELWQSFEHSQGFQLRITQEAIDYIKTVLTEPYLRLGAQKGGCSGWLYIVSPDKSYNPDNDLILTIAPGFAIIVDAQQATNLLKKVRVYMKNLSFGNQLKVEREGEGTHCGCGESFA